MAAFEEVGICPELITACEELGWSLPTDIQAEVVPLILGGGDVMAAAETGSGKTGAFSLPVVQIVHERLRRGPGEDEGVVGGAAGAGAGAWAADCPDGRLVLSRKAADRSSVVAVSEDGMQCQARSDAAWGGVRGTKGVSLAGGSSRSDPSGRSGTVYYEVVVEDEGLCRVGWTTKTGSLELGTDHESFGYGGTGKKSHGRKFEDYGERFGMGDVIGCWVDVARREVGFAKNGVDLGVAFAVGKKVKMLCPAVTLKNAQVRVAFEEADLRFLGGTSNGQVALGAVATELRAGNPPGGPSDPSVPKLPVAIVLEPVRDLAQQTKDVMETFASKMTEPSVRVSLLIGGESANQQAREISAGSAIVVGTPGRINDMVNQNKMDVSGVKFFVLDEADALLEAGHRDVILNIFRQLGTAGTGVNRLQTLLFSATLHSPHVMRLANELCQNAAFIDMKGMNALPDAVDHTLVLVDPQEDRTWLQSTPAVCTDRVHEVDPPLDPTSSGDDAWSHAVKVLKPRLLQRVLQGLEIDRALIFCRTNFDCENLETFFRELDKLDKLDANDSMAASSEKRKRSTRYSCAILAGAKSMDERRAALDAFKSEDVRFLIATDVAARGIDVSGLPFVINMTLPDKCEDYVHRSGRVGRAETPGLCISLVSAVPGKVWFCRKKGLKPWLNPTKEHVSTTKGGHAAWIDEKVLLRDIEDRLGAAIVPLQSDMSLPPSLVGSRERYGKGGNAGGAGGASAEVTARIEASRDSAKNLTALEHKAQQTFFSLKTMFC